MNLLSGVRPTPPMAPPTARKARCLTRSRRTKSLRRLHRRSRAAPWPGEGWGWLVAAGARQGGGRGRRPRLRRNTPTLRCVLVWVGGLFKIVCMYLIFIFCTRICIYFIFCLFLFLVLYYTNAKYILLIRISFEAKLTQVVEESFLKYILIFYRLILIAVEMYKSKTVVLEPPGCFWKITLMENQVFTMFKMVRDKIKRRFSQFILL